MGEFRDGGPESTRAAHLRKRDRLHREARYLHLFHAAIVGVLAGALAVAYEFTCNQAEDLSRGAAVAAKSAGMVPCILMVLACAAIGAACSYLVGRYVPEASGGGVSHIKAVLLHLRVLKPIRVIVAKFLGGVAALMIGLSFGREGPTVQMGGAVGKIVGDGLNVSRRGRNALIAAGGGAGLAAAFNAPLAGFLFVMEEMRREFSALTYGSALMACVCSVAMTRYLSGLKPQLTLPSPGQPPLSILPEVAIMGLVCGVGGLLYNSGLIGSLDLRSRLKMPRWVAGALVGAIAGIALLTFDYISGSGQGVTQNLLLNLFHAKHLAFFLLAIFFGKLLLTSASYGTGMPGGIFVPILVLGALLGYTIGIGFHWINPSIPFTPSGFGTLGMAALLAAAVRAPLTATVLIVELTGEYSLLYALLVGSFTASLAAEWLRSKPIYDALMERELRIDGPEIAPEVEPLLLDVLIEPHSRMDGVRVRSLGLPPGAILTTVERFNRQIVPGGSTLLNSGDMVTILIEGDKPELSYEIHEMAKAPS